MQRLPALSTAQGCWSICARMAIACFIGSQEEWHDLAARFERWDRTKPGYFPSILQAIGTGPGTPAAELAQAAGAEKLKFKQDVRKLKELGLTESLEIGYRLSPRGEAVLEKLREHRL